MPAHRTSIRTDRFSESVIREMTRLILLHHPDDGVNLAQGFPDFPAPQAIKDTACEAIQHDLNQYAITWGTAPLLQAIARKTAAGWGRPVDPEGEVTVCCCATETMYAALMATLDPGDEVVIFSPFYENYGPNFILVGALPRTRSRPQPRWPQLSAPTTTPICWPRIASAATICFQPLPRRASLPTAPPVRTTSLPTFPALATPTMSAFPATWYRT